METLEAPPQALEELSNYEIERGKPVPSKLHSRVRTLLILALGQHGEGYDTLSELELELGGRRLIPDLCVYPSTAISYAEDQPRLTEPPLLAVEIASPAQAGGVLFDKIAFVLGVGVRSCWLVQPLLRIVTVFHPGQPPRTFTKGAIDDDTFAFRLAVEDVFPPAPARSGSSR